MYQYPILTIKPITTAHLAQTMTLLGMTSAELSQRIESELAKNPALELVEDRRCPTCRRTLTDPGPCPVCSRPKTSSAEEPIVFISSQSEGYLTQTLRTTNIPYEDLPEDNVAPPEDLSTYVMRQIASELSIDDRGIAAHILTSLDDDGLLTVPVSEISRYHHVSMSSVEKIVRLIQKADPIGVGSNSPKEALLVQLEVLRENNNNVPELTETAIQEGMSFLSKHQYGDLAKRLGITKSNVEEIALFIGNNLNPFPGRAHWGDIRQRNNDNPQVYHQPDIIVRQLSSQSGGSLIVEVLLPLRGTLQINSLFRQTIKQAPEENTEKWKRDLEEASLFIKCIQQRNNTMQRLMTHIAKHQRAFILKGDQYLRPTTRADVAKDLNVHESTISRAVAGKSLQLPSGKIIPLSCFFDRSLHIRSQLIEIIQFEKHPFTDSQLAAILSKRGINIARRTVAKYRAMEGILPAHLRKNLKKTK
jgi:RNA polymerase sigma-54 factor